MLNKLTIPITVGVNDNIFIGDKYFYTSDVDSAYLVFNVSGLTDFTGASASLTLAAEDTSLFQHELLNITSSPINYMIQSNEIRHFGNVTGQLEIKQNGTIITTREFIFEIKQSLGDIAVGVETVREVVVDDFETLKRQMEQVHDAVVSEWGVITATLSGMENTYSTDWSTWFAGEKTSVATQWAELKAEVEFIKQNVSESEITRQLAETSRLSAESTRGQNESTRNNAETERNSKEAYRISNENSRNASEVDRVNNENARLSKEAARDLAEVARDEDEAERLSAEYLRKEKELARQDSEAVRVTTENTRRTSELERLSAESIRGNQELNRDNQEVQRFNQEETRKSNETTRISQENSRKSVEITRTINEAARVLAENNREAHRNDFDVAEGDRIAAETQRAQTEVVRIAAESTRIANELDRLEEETNRAAAEVIRIASESGRLTAESGRVGAETTRQTQEAARQVTIAQAETQVDNAELSASEAQQAMTDVLAMIAKPTGEGIATLLDGKLSPSQIPALSINDTFPITNVSELLTLIAQKGDVAIVVANDVVTDSYILAGDSPSVAGNWKKLGVSYVAEAGHAATATSADNANTINNHRVVTLTQSEYNLAVKEPNTLYVVFG